MDVTLLMSGLIVLLADHRASPGATPMKALMVEHKGHTAGLTIDLDDIDLKASDAATIVVPAGKGGIGGWFITKSVTLGGTGGVDLKPDTGEVSCTDALADVQRAWGKDAVHTNADHLPFVAVAGGHLACINPYTPTDPWRFCPLKGNGSVDTGSCAKDAQGNYVEQKTLSPTIFWKVASDRLMIDGKTVVFKTGHSPVVNVFNETGDLKPLTDKVLKHYIAVYEKVLGETGRPKQFLPYNGSLSSLIATRRASPATITIKGTVHFTKIPSAPERCPGGIAYRAP